MVKKNCRFCKNMTDWNADEHGMWHFDCTYWEQKLGKAEYPIWIWPEMNVSCDEGFEAAGATAYRVFELEQELDKVNKDNKELIEEKEEEIEKLKKALSQG